LFLLSCQSKLGRMVLRDEPVWFVSVTCCARA